MFIVIPMTCLHMLLSFLKVKHALFHLPCVVFERTSQLGQICKCLSNWCPVSFHWDACFEMGKQTAEGCNTWRKYCHKFKAELVPPLLKRVLHPAFPSPVPAKERTTAQTCTRGIWAWKINYLLLIKTLLGKCENLWYLSKFESFGSAQRNCRRQMPCESPCDMEIKIPDVPF